MQCTTQGTIYNSRYTIQHKTDTIYNLIYNVQQRIQHTTLATTYNVHLKIQYKTQYTTLDIRRTRIREPSIIVAIIRFYSRKCSIMVWGGVSYDRRTDLIVVLGNLTGQRYVMKLYAPLLFQWPTELDVTSSFKMIMPDPTELVLWLTFWHKKALWYFYGLPDLLTCRQ